MKGTSFQERLDAVSKRAENQRCCDCFDRQPGFASIVASPLGEPIGAFLCFRCSRVHENLGNDICYVLNVRNADECKLFDSIVVIFQQSTTHLVFTILDAGAAEEVGALERGGNKIANAIFESKLAFDHPRPDSNSGIAIREKFCFDKYVNRKFYSKSAAGKYLNQSKPKSSKLFSLKAPKGGSVRKSSNSLQASFSSIEMSSDDEVLETAPGSQRNGLGYGDAAPDSERQIPRQRRSRRRASIGTPEQGQLDGSRHEAERRPPSSTRSFNVPKRQTSTRRANPVAASVSSGLNSGDDEGFGYGDAAPDSAIVSCNGEAAPNSEHQKPRQRRSRRRASIGTPAESSIDKDQLGYGDARPDSDQRGPPSQGRRAPRRSSLGKALPITDAAVAGRRRPGRRGSVGKSPSLSQTLPQSSSGNELDSKSAHSRRSGGTNNQPLGDSQHGTARKNTRRRGSVSGGNTSFRRVTKTPSDDSLVSGGQGSASKQMASQKNFIW